MAHSEQRSGRQPNEDLARALRSLRRATAQMRQYPEGHPVLRDALGHCQGLLNDALERTGPTALSVGPDRMAVNDEDLPLRLHDETRLHSRLRELSVVGVDFRPGCDLDVVHALFSLLTLEYRPDRDEHGEWLARLGPSSCIHVRFADYDRLVAIDPRLAAAHGVMSAREAPTASADDLLALRTASARVFAPDFGSDRRDARSLHAFLEEPQLAAVLLQEPASATKAEPWPGAAEAPSHQKPTLGSVIAGRAPTGHEASTRQIVGLIRRVKQACIDRRTASWAALLPKLADVLMSLSNESRHRIFTSEAQDTDTALRELAGVFPPELRAETLVPNADTLLSTSSDGIARALSRLCPEPGMSQTVSELVKGSLARAALPPQLYVSAVEVVERLSGSSEDRLAEAYGGEAKLRDLLPGVTADLADISRWRDASPLSRWAYTLGDLIAHSTVPAELRKVTILAAREMVRSLESASIAPASYLAKRVVSAVARGSDEVRQDAAQDIMAAVRDANCADKLTALSLSPWELAYCMGLVGARPVLAGILCGDDASARKVAAEYLTVWGDTAYDAVESVLSDAETGRIAEVCASLWRAGDTGVCRYFHRAIESEEPEARVAAIAEVAAFPSAATVEVIQASLDDPHPPVRAEAIRALGRIALPEAVQALCSIFDDGANERTHDELGGAVLSLSQIRLPSSVQALAGILMDRRRLSTPEGGRVRARAAEALATFDSMAATEALNAGLQDSDGAVYYACWSALADRGGGRGA